MKQSEKLNSTIINVLFLFFPVSLILGNLLTNLNILLLCFFAILFYRKKLIKLEINILDKVLLVFFLYTILTLVVHFIDNYLDGQIFSKMVMIKTLLNLKYLIFYFVVRMLINKKILNLDWFALACSACAAFICVDIFIQFLFGRDIFGIVPPYPGRYSGVFGVELIAGGYLQKFSLFCLFLPFVLKKKLLYKISFQIIIFSIFIVGIILSGNRMPLILYIFSFLIYIMLEKQIRKYFILIFSIIFLVLIFNIIINKNFSLKMQSFYGNGTYLIKTLLTKDIEDMEKEPEAVWLKSHVAEVYCSTYSFKKNPAFGGGIRSYRTHTNCITHPHNYYLEMLSDLGLIGLSIVLVFVFMMIFKIFIQKIKPLKINLNSLDARALPFFLIFITEFFPLRTTGSFFTTNNASIIFLVLAILVSLISKKKVYNN
jgi:O-antigen ligase